VPRILLLLTPALALVLVPSNVVVAGLPLMREEWATSATAMGWVFGAYQAGYVGAVLLLLPLTDRVPAGRVIAVCALGTALAFLAFAFFAHDVTSAAAIRVVAGAGLAGVYMPGVRVVSAAASEARRGLAVSLYVSAFYIGSTASLWLTGAMLPSLGWRGAALVLGAVAALALPLALLAARGESTPMGRSARLTPDVLRNGPVLRTILGYTGHCWELYVSRGWMAAFLAAVLAAQGLGPVESAAEGGKWAALIAGIGIVAVWIGGWLSDRWGRARTGVIVGATSGMVSITLGAVAGLGWELLLLVGCLHGLLLAGDAAVYHTAITELAPRNQLGSAQAMQASIGFVASTLGPVAGGMVLDLGGGFGGVFVTAGLATAAGALVLWPVARAERPPLSAHPSPSPPRKGSG
jgi:MFS family permease